MRHLSPLVDKRILRPSETVLALDMISETDLLRLKTIARLYARGLPPDVAWDDLSDMSCNESVMFGFLVFAPGAR